MIREQATYLGKIRGIAICLFPLAVERKHLMHGFWVLTRELLKGLMLSLVNAELV